jgi:hypothetical protein
MFVNSLDSVVVTMASDGLDDPYIFVRFLAMVRDYSIGSVQAISGIALPPIQLVVGVLSLYEKRQARVADHSSSSSSVEVKSKWIEVSTLPYIFIQSTGANLSFLL